MNNRAKTLQAIRNQIAAVAWEFNDVTELAEAVMAQCQLPELYFQDVSTIATLELRQYRQ